MVLNLCTCMLSLLKHLFLTNHFYKSSEIFIRSGQISFFFRWSEPDPDPGQLDLDPQPWLSASRKEQNYVIGFMSEHFVQSVIFIMENGLCITGKKSGVRIRIRVFMNEKRRTLTVRTYVPGDQPVKSVTVSLKNFLPMKCNQCILQPHRLHGTYIRW